jgi:hypothetical protein
VAGCHLPSGRCRAFLIIQTSTPPSLLNGRLQAFSDTAVGESLAGAQRPVQSQDARPWPAENQLAIESMRKSSICAPL